MEASDCPIHSAALVSRKRNAVEPLLRKVTARSRTEECRECLLCRKALECLTDPTPDSWSELWHGSFKPLGPGAEAMEPGPLYIACSDCGERIDTGLRMRSGPDAFQGDFALRCPHCSKVVSFRAADTFH